LPKGMKVGAFVDFIDLSWIPRYIVINETGVITLFNATKASDSLLQAALKKAI
ncbi:MAG TPA: redoxin, partial [Polaribacter sp.]|nr:redoxin [Polaribacter sp.]